MPSHWLTGSSGQADRRSSADRMACTLDVLCTTLATLLVLLSHPCEAAEVRSCLAGYSSSQRAKVNALPSGTTTFGARTQVECTALCARQKNCLQVYFNDTAGKCHLIPSGASLVTTPSSRGRLVTAPSPTMISGKSCNSLQCPSGSVCMSDCSTTFGGAMCAADNAQCPQDTHVINVKHYYTGIYNDGQDNGIVHTVTFNKTRGDTALRVLWFASTRAHYHAAGYCGRYYFTFNGSQCTNPNNIDFSNYDGCSTDHHRFSELDGMCYGLPAGVVTVSIVVGACPNWGVTDSWTGWQASRSMWVYELNTAATTASSQCPYLPLVNTQYFSAFDIENGMDPDNQIMAMTYQKVSSDTVLRVKWQGTARVYLPNDVGYCGRWYITVNGVECNPRAEFVLGMYSSSYYNAVDNHKTRTLEGFCYGLAAGSYTVALRIGACYYATGQPDAMTGCCSSVSRITVSEVRLATTTQAVTTADGRVMKIPFFNLQHWYWYLLNSETDVGNVLTVTYNKLSDTSGLHLRAVGDARVWGSSSCCRWYFTINGAECTNPGVIEGVSYMEYVANYHNPGVVDGVCYGFSSGSYSIGYNVGTCLGFGAADCYTGWGSTLHITAEEVQPDSRVTCDTPFSCP